MSVFRGMVYVSGGGAGFVFFDPLGRVLKSGVAGDWPAAVDSFVASDRCVVFRPDLLTVPLALAYWASDGTADRWCWARLRVSAFRALWDMHGGTPRVFTPALRAAWECYGGLRPYSEHPCAPAFEVAGIDLDVCGRSREVLREIFDPTLFVDRSHPERRNRLFRYLRLSGKDDSGSFFGVDPRAPVLRNARKFVRLIAGTWELVRMPELGLFDDEKFFGKDYKMLSEYRAAVARQVGLYGASATP